MALWWPILRLFGGPVLAASIYLLAIQAWPHPASATAALGGWMAWWWISEAIPLPATALLPIVWLPVLGIRSSEQSRAIVDAVRPYADPNVFTYLGGFVLALAIERWGLHRRWALALVLAIGTSPGRLLAGAMAATGLMSMWISNTAATTIMLPIGLGIAGLLATDRTAPSTETQAASARSSGGGFAAAVLLGIAYAASLGGMATIVGTPTNGVALNVLRSQGLDVDFQTWLWKAGPLALMLLIGSWTILYLRYRRELPFSSAHSAASSLREQWQALGPMSRGERLVLMVFLATAASWMFRGLIIERWGLGSRWPALQQIDDTWIAIAAAIALFSIPVDWRRSEFLMDWPTAQRLPWGVLLLFGGGLSLASAMQSSGLLLEIEQLLRGLRGIPPTVVVVVLVASVVALSELASNVAVATAFTPLILALAVALELPTIPLVMATTLAASCGFMLPVATPPNAIVFGTGRIPQREMIRVGWWLDLLCIAVIAAAMPWLG
jgi:sodium-dependent dicarboxylate transporter 2/3/5